MNRKEEFESVLTSIADAPVGFAGGRQTSRLKEKLSRLQGEIDSEAVLREIRSAKARYAKDPSLFSGDPDGFFTYEDPVLAITAYIYQAHRLMSDALGIAGDEGASLRNTSFLDWVETGVHMWLTRNSKSFLTLMGMTAHAPLEFNKDVVRIAVVGDAGFSGQAQSNVLYKIRERHREAPFDLLIHLGDIYFAGSAGEVQKNFLAPFMSSGLKVLTLIGNHDLYFGGGPILGALDILGQTSRYFSIDTPHWRVACLDTALPAERMRRNSGLLDKGQLAWLDEHLSARDGRKTILMSHHYIVSGWEKSSEGLKRQLGERVKKVFSWYWGHEHGCATYDKKSAGFHGACVGNGAFLEVWKPPTGAPLPDWYATSRCSCYEEGSKFWPHGYLELELQPKRLVESYHIEGEKTHTRILRRG